jgi:4-amino-4-deoxy-L-arabinose transferase-like glycosyltransferase
MRAVLADRILEPAGRVADALADPRKGGRTALILIVVYVLLWWAFAVVDNSSHSIHFDMSEMFAWSLEPAFGYPKHPPFAVWVVTAWFAVFPRTDWAYYLLSMACIGVAMWFVWLIAKPFVSGPKRAVALVLLAFTLVFNFLAFKYNPNALLVPVWAAATWLFLRSWRERTAASGALAGLAAAVAMLTKYWSVFLLVGFAAAVLMDRRRADYFRSPAPYAAAVAGALAIAPNIASLVHDDFQPFHYAAAMHVAATLGQILGKLLNYSGGLLYLTGAVVALALASRPTAAAWRDMLWPRDADRRFMAVIQWVAFLAPVAVALAMRVQLDSLWTVCFWSMLPALLLSSAKIAITRRAAAAILTAAFVAPCVAIAAAPAASLLILRQGGNRSQSYYSLVAHEVDRLWPGVSSKPLRFVAGTQGLAWGCTFYCRDRPRAFPDYSRSEAPWIDPADLARAGFVALCPAADRRCLDEARTLAAGNAGMREETATLARQVFGQRGEARSFTIVLAPPRP